MNETDNDLDAETKAPRKLSREARRSQLIEATLQVLSERGYSRTTLSEVARRADLSHGLVNFHFETKEKLLSETLMFLSDEYRDHWKAALDGAGPSPARQMDAMIRADFSGNICSQERIAAWCAFWGEAQSRPLYQERCGQNDVEYTLVLEGICERLIAEGGYDTDPRLAARVLAVTAEGVWLEMMRLTTPYDIEEGLRTVMACAAAFFPKHFTISGLREA